MNIYNKISQRTLGIYDVKMVTVGMTMLVGDTFYNYFRVNSDMIENTKTMEI